MFHKQKKSEVRLEGGRRVKSSKKIRPHALMLPNRSKCWPGVSKVGLVMNVSVSGKVERYSVGHLPLVWLA